MEEEQSSISLLILSSLSCWALSFLLLISTISSCNRFTSASIFPAFAAAFSYSEEKKQDYRIDDFNASIF